ncbi:MAG: hypothetical protein AB7K52_00735 [Phycisphaerales bacterium]
MNQTTFVATMRAWVEAMEEERYEQAYQTGVQLLIVGLPLADSLDLSELSFGLDEWRKMHAEELLHNLVGFVCTVSVAAADREQDTPTLPFPRPPAT